MGESNRARVPLDFSRDELLILTNSLNEVCNGGHLDEEEFHPRIGAERSEVLAVFRRVQQTYREG